MATVTGPEQEQDQPPTEAVLYGAKSSPDPAGSIETQLTDCRGAAEAEGRKVIGEFSDEAFSAYKANRGPGLERAKRLAVERGAELWVQHSDRLARGDGLTADHLAEVYFALRRFGVRLRSVEDDENLSDAIRAVLIGERNFEDSKRDGAATAAGIERAARRGDWLGGILADGYRVLRDVDAAGKVTRRVEFDPDRKPIYDLIWDLARRGFSSIAIVTELDRKGHLTRPRKSKHRARPFDANRVRQTLGNPFYAGLAIHRGEVVGEGNWPSYVEPEDFHRLREERSARSRAGRRRGPGRPPEGYLLARIAVCGQCGSPMDIVPGHVRKDGTRPRRYVCRTHRERPADCASGPFDAALVDPAMVDNLASILGDVEAIREGVAAARDADRARLEAEAHSAREEAEDADRAMQRMAARVAALYAGGEDDKAAGLEEAISHVRARGRAARTRLDAALGAIEAPADQEDASVFDDAAFWERLRAELSSRVEEARSDVKRLNAALCDFLDSVALTHAGGGAIRLLPRLSDGAALRILRDAGRWPHGVSLTVDAEGPSEDLRGAVEEVSGDEVTFRLQVPKGESPEELGRRLLNHDVDVRIGGPPAFDATSDGNPRPPW